MKVNNILESMSWWRKNKQPTSKQSQEVVLNQDGITLEEDNLYGELSIKGQFWTINRQKYEKGKWEKILKRKQQIAARYFQIYLPEPNFVKHIITIKFSNLRALYLGSNQIKSLECFPQLDAPFLRDLQLNNNQITSIRSLRKCSMKFDHILIDDNPIADLRGLSQINFYKQIQRNFVSTFNQNIRDQNPFQINITNATQLAKAEPGLVFQQFPLDKLRKTFYYTPRHPNQKILNSIQLKKCETQGVSVNTHC